MAAAAQRLYDLDRSSTKFPRQLNTLLHEAYYVDDLQKLPKGELIQLINHLNSILDRLDSTSDAFRKCLQVLQEICCSKQILPTTYELVGARLAREANSIIFGGFCDAHKGTLTEDVCIKKLRISSTSRKKVEELFCKEAIVWKRLNHPNIVPFKGVTLNPLQLISEWVPGGELPKYVEENQHVNMINLLLGVAEGLGYLHSCNVVHGDLKGPNIVVDASGNARITDFGLATIVRDPKSLAKALDDQGHSPRWAAPEILQSTSPATKESDVFAFAMVVIEVFTRKNPFSEKIAYAAAISITSGQRPGKPGHPEFTDPLWELTQRCWDQKAQNRPKIQDVIKALKDLSTNQSAKSTRMPLQMPNHVNVTPYDLGTPQPGRTPPPPSRDDGNRNPISKRERLKKEREAQEREEMIERENKQKELERERREKEAQEAAKLKEAREREEFERQKVLERQRREKEAEEATKKAKEAEEAAKKLEEAREREKRQKELEREKKEAARKAKDAEEAAKKAKEAGEAAKKLEEAKERENLERQKEFERERKNREAEEAAKKAREAREHEKLKRQKLERERREKEANEAAEKAKEVEESVKKEPEGAAKMLKEARDREKLEGVAGGTGADEGEQPADGAQSQTLMPPKKKSCLRRFFCCCC